MSATDDVKTLGRSRLSFATQADLDEFVETLDAFENGRLTPDQWRGFRLVRGLYGQRQEDLHMIRVKVPQGILNGEQLEALAEVVERHSRGFGHITTRQNIQFHFVQLHDAEPAFERLAATGLTTREACGNSVRNITACQYAGTAADEVFDVTPYAEALTRYFLRHPLSASLPRKFKIAFEGCVEDHAFTGINDIGWRAAARQRGRPARAGLPRHGGRRHRDDVAGWRGAVRLPAGWRNAQCRRSDRARVPSPRRLPAQAQEPDEVPHQAARMGAIPDRSASGVRSRARQWRPVAALRARRASGRASAGVAASGRARCHRDCATRDGVGGEGPRVHPDRHAGPAGSRPRISGVAEDQRASPEATRLRTGHDTVAIGRLHRRADANHRRPRGCLRRWRRAHHA